MTRRDQRRRAHPERRAVHLPGAAGRRRPGLGRPLQRDLRLELGGERACSRRTASATRSARRPRRDRASSSSTSSTPTSRPAASGSSSTRSSSGTSTAARITKYLMQHELKAGLEYETQDATVTKRMSGGQQVDVVQVTPATPARPRSTGTSTGRRRPRRCPTTCRRRELDATPKHKMLSAYLQDSWAVAPEPDAEPRRALGPAEDLRLASGTEQIDLNNDFAPRLGVVWDPTSDHRTKVYGSFGYFYEQIPMDLVIRSFSFERQPRIFNYDPTSTVPDDGAAGDRRARQRRSSAASPSRPTRTSRASTSASSSSAPSARSCRTSAWASRTSTATTAG